LQPKDQRSQPLYFDKQLAVLVQQYGPWIYAILFVIIFSETGFVVTPFLPGDSLLFVVGIGAMTYARFALFNLIGGIGWVGSLTLLGYWFGNMPWIQQNLTLVILAIIGLSFVPLLIGWLQHRRSVRGSSRFAWACAGSTDFAVN
jgi:membrane protein DedA with SNARE-associated domain